MLWLRSMVVLLMLGAATAGVYAASPPMTDWKLYRSESFGFEVRYPSTWLVRQSTGTMESVALSETPEAGRPYRMVQFIVQRAINPKRLDIKQWYADQLKKVGPSPLLAIDTTLARRPAIRMENVGTLGKQFTLFTLLNETDIFQITISQPSSASQLDPLYEAIISSVRFVN